MNFGCDFQIPCPFENSLTDFLTGGQKAYDIDRRFSVPFAQLTKDYLISEMVLGAPCASVKAVGYVFCDVFYGTSQGVALVSPDNTVVGLYLGGALAICPVHQGQGLGAELAFEYAFRMGALPTWYMDLPAFSPSGYYAHCRAWYLARDPSFVGAKNLLGDDRDSNLLLPVPHGSESLTIDIRHQEFASQTNN